MAQVGEEPPFLTVGTEVSAKYRGAFCEASIKSVKKVVKCKVTFSKTNASSTVNDDCIKGTLKVGSTVEVKSQDGQSQEASIVKLTDASVYTVVFDDGDERTLRRTSLCLKGERHFNESETLDHLPLTDPENFGTPVMQDGKKRKKRSLSQAASMDDSETEKDDTEPQPSKKKIVFNDSIVGKVVVIENSEKKKQTWFPGLGVSPNSSDSHLIKTKDQCLVRSFKDGKYHVINVKNVKKFARNAEPVASALKGDSRMLKLAIERALSYEGTGKVPVNWEDTNSSNGEEAEEEDITGSLKAQRAFNQKLFTFMEEKGTPILRPPVLGNQDLNLHKLYNLVKDIGGMEKVNSPVQWRTLYSKMDIPAIPPSASHHIKMAYKKYLYAYEMHEKGIDIIGKDTDSERSNDDKTPEESSTGRSSRNSLRIEERERQNEAKQFEAKTSKEAEKTKRNESEELEVEIESDVKSPESEVAVDVVNSPGTASVESDQTSESRSEDGSVTSDFSVGDKVQVKYGRGRNHRLYEAKIISTDTEAEEGLMFCVHYAGWNHRYDEWIKPDRISGIGTRQTRKRSTSLSKEVVPLKSRKSPPKPVSKATPKLSGKKNFKSVLPALSPKSARGLATNGGKGSRRAGSPNRQPDTKKSSPALGKATPPVTRKSPSPALGKSSSTSGKSPSPAMGKSVSGASVKPQLTSPKSGPGRGRLRTERQNSMPDLRRGEEEGIKSPTQGGRRRKKSLTPEPTSAASFTEELSPLAQPLTEDDTEKENDKIQERVPAVKSEPESDSADTEASTETKTNETSRDIEVKTEVSSEPDEKHLEENVITSNRKREKLKRVNGLIISSNLENLAPAAKHIKLDKDNELADKEIENLLKNSTQEKSPVASPQTEGSTTSGDFSSCSSSDIKLKVDEVGRIETESASSELKSLKGERSDSPSLSCSDKSDAKDKKENRKAQKSSDRKNNERHHKSHRGRREKRKHRHNSGNESTGSDVPPSPGPSSSPFCKPSPSRPRITFEQELEQIKAKADSAERIRLMQEKIGEMRKIYSSLKAEVASIDRKKKRQRKKREEQAAAAAAVTGESMKDSKSSTSAVAPQNVQAVECR